MEHNIECKILRLLTIIMVLKELLEDILVQGTKITHRMLPPDLNVSKNVATVSHVMEAPELMYRCWFCCWKKVVVMSLCTMCQK